VPDALVVIDHQDHRRPYSTGRFWNRNDGLRRIGVRTSLQHCPIYRQVSPMP
jgi:hypothetical protein